MTLANWYYLIKVGQRPLMALPNVSRSILLSAIKLYPAQTWKKKILRCMVWLTFFLRINSLIWQKVKSPLNDDIGFDFLSWLKTIKKDLNQSAESAVVVWPAQANRGRVYIYLMDSNGQATSFAKLSLDSNNDRQIFNESKTLEELDNLSLQHTCMPSIKSQGTFQERRYIIVESIPKEAILVDWAKEKFPHQSFEEYAGTPKFIKFSQLEQMDWWQRFWENYNSIPVFAQEVQKSRARDIQVCRIHGDLGSTNLFRAKNKLWLVDWEQSSKYGPILTDEIAFYLAAHCSQIRSNSKLSLKDFSHDYLCNTTYINRQNVIMALAYLHSVKFPLATELISQWQCLAQLEDQII